MQKVRFLNFRESVCNFSLGFRTIGPSDFEWVLVLRVFDKLREVGVLSYVFYSLFKCFVNG